MFSVYESSDLPELRYLYEFTLYRRSIWRPGHTGYPDETFVRCGQRVARNSGCLEVGSLEMGSSAVESKVVGYSEVGSLAVHVFMKIYYKIDFKRTEASILVGNEQHLRK